MNAKRGHFFMWGTRVKLVSTHDQQETEQDDYQNALGFSGSFLFADNLEEARVMVAANRGFLPVESVSGLS